LKYYQVTDRIVNLCNDQSLDFRGRGSMIQKELNECTKDDIINHLDNAGVIPERYGHDSTEEKLFAKYCDALLACAWCQIGLDAFPIQERSDAADVIGKGDGYDVVGDAKAFRLSRTAKNQKDFKVESLNQWRKDAEYACLVGPLYQYPSRTSQIYLQAIRYNVTILSFTHMSFMIKVGFQDGTALKKLWEATKDIKISKDAEQYWNRINKVMLEITGASAADWRREVKESAKRLPIQGLEQLNYWEEVKARISHMPKEVLVDELIKALKIEAKIEVIKRSAGIVESSAVEKQEEIQLEIKS